MQINISTRHGNLGAQSQEKITDKVLKLTRFHERLTSTTVTIDLENEERPGVEIQVTAEKARRFVASNTSESLMNSYGFWSSWNFLGGGGDEPSRKEKRFSCLLTQPTNLTNPHFHVLRKASCMLRRQSDM